MGTQKTVHIQMLHLGAPVHPKSRFPSHSTSIDFFKFLFKLQLPTNCHHWYFVGLRGPPISEDHLTLAVYNKINSKLLLDKIKAKLLSNSPPGRWSFQTL